MERVYRKTCDVLLKHSSLADDVPQYLKLLAIAQSGADTSKGIDGRAFREIVWKLTDGTDSSSVMHLNSEIRVGKKSERVAEAIAEWLFNKTMERETLYLNSAIASVGNLFGHAHIERDKSGKHVFDTTVLTNLRKKSVELIKWNSARQCWIRTAASKDSEPEPNAGEA